MRFGGSPTSDARVLVMTDSLTYQSSENIEDPDDEFLDADDCSTVILTAPFL